MLVVDPARRSRRSHRAVQLQHFSSKAHFLYRLAMNPPSSSSLTKRESTISFTFSAAAFGFVEAISCKTTWYPSSGGRDSPVCFA